MEKQYLTFSPGQTQKRAGALARDILKADPRTINVSRLSSRFVSLADNKAIVIGLEGDLGSGKTTFLQGFAKELGIKEKILSPTFVILKKFKIQNSKFKNFYHIDCYRIERSKEILDLGFKKIISNPQNIVAVEWAERIKKIMPKNTIWIKFSLINKNTRKIRGTTP